MTEEEQLESKKQLFIDAIVGCHVPFRYSYEGTHPYAKFTGNQWN